MSNYKTAGLDFDNQFDPDTVGDGPTAPGYKQGAVPLKYADIKYGVKGPDCGYKQAGVDVSNLWAKKGTAAYSLPLNGNTYTSAGSTLGTGACVAELNFQINTSGWSLVASGTNATTTTLASGAMPSGAVSIQITDTWLNSAGDTDAGTTTNTCSTYTTIPLSGTVGCSVIESHAATSGQTTHRIVITMKNASGAVISTTTTTFLCITSRG